MNSKEDVQVVSTFNHVLKLGSAARCSYELLGKVLQRDTKNLSLDSLWGTLWITVMNSNEPQATHVVLNTNWNNHTSNDEPNLESKSSQISTDKLQITNHKSQLSVNNWVANHNNFGTKWEPVYINLEVKNKKHFYCTSKGIAAACDLYWTWSKAKSLNITTRSACLANQSARFLTGRPRGAFLCFDGLNPSTLRVTV